MCAANKLRFNSAEVEELDWGKDEGDSEARRGGTQGFELSGGVHGQIRRHPERKFVSDHRSGGTNRIDQLFRRERLAEAADSDVVKTWLVTDLRVTRHEHRAYAKSMPQAFCNRSSTTSARQVPIHQGQIRFECLSNRRRLAFIADQGSDFMA